MKVFIIRDVCRSSDGKRLVAPKKNKYKDQKRWKVPAMVTDLKDIDKNLVKVQIHGNSCHCLISGAIYAINIEYLACATDLAWNEMKNQEKSEEQK